MTTVATESLEGRSSEWAIRALAAQRACRPYIYPMSSSSRLA